MFEKLGVQLYTIRDFLKDPEFADLSFRRLHELGYTQAQTAGLPAFDGLQFGELAKKNGIEIVGTHYDWSKIVNEPEETMTIHRAWGTTNVGIGGMPKEARGDLAELKKFVKLFNDTAAAYAKEGFKLTYHNHQFESARIDGYKTLMDILYEELDPSSTSFVLDTCWVAAGGADVTGWMEKLAGRIDILHLKDLTLKPDVSKFTATMTEIGNGNLAWDKIIETAERIGVKSYVVEQDTNWTDSPFNSLKISADFLAKYRK